MPNQTRRHAAFAEGLTALVVAAVAAAALSLGTPGTTLAWSNGSFSSSDEASLVALHNAARADIGVQSLTVDPVLTDVARWRSKDMFDRDYFSHTTPEGTKVYDELKKRGYCYTLAGENIGSSTYPDDMVVQRMFDGWMGSPGHRANILGSAWTRVGIGAYKGSDGRKLFTVLFAQPCATTLAPATKTLQAQCATNLRTGPSNSDAIKVKVAQGTELAVMDRVAGGRWKGKCAGTYISGRYWYRVTAINGVSVKSLYGVTYLYAPRARVG